MRGFFFKKKILEGIAVLKEDTERNPISKKRVSLVILFDFGGFLGDGISGLLIPYAREIDTERSDKKRS